MNFEPNGYYLYLIGEMGTRNTKIGIGRNPEHRLRSLQTGNPRQLKILHAWDIGSYSDPKFIERRIHGKLQQLQLTGEWFSLPSNHMIDYIEDLIPGLRQGYVVGSS